MICCEKKPIHRGPDRVRPAERPNVLGSLLNVRETCIDRRPTGQMTLSVPVMDLFKLRSQSARQFVPPAFLYRGCNTDIADQSATVGIVSAFVISPFTRVNSTEPLKTLFASFLCGLNFFVSQACDGNDLNQVSLFML